MRNRQRWSWARVILALAVACAAFGALVTSGVSPDDEIPGVPIPASPFAGSLTETDNPYALDRDDVYGLTLGLNNRLDVAMTVPATGDFDVYLFAPGTKSVARALQPPYPQLLAYAGQHVPGAPEGFTYVSDSIEATMCFLGVRAWAGSGPYEIAWTTTTLPSPVVVSGAPPTVAYRGSALVTGTVDAGESPLTGALVEVLQSPAGTPAWTRAATATVSPSEDFEFAVSPRRRTRYRVKTHWIQTPGGAVGYGFGPIMTVTPKAYLTIARAPSRAVPGRTFTAKGYLKPSHSASTRHVYVNAYRRNARGKWVFKRTFSARNSGYRWSASVKLPSTGRWRLKAMARPDALHAKTYSSWRYVRVTR